MAHEAMREVSPDLLVRVLVELVAPGLGAGGVQPTTPELVSN